MLYLASSVQSAEPAAETACMPTTASIFRHNGLRALRSAERRIDCPCAPDKCTAPCGAVNFILILSDSLRQKGVQWSSVSSFQRKRSIHLTVHSFHRQRWFARAREQHRTASVAQRFHHDEKRRRRRRRQDR